MSREDVNVITANPKTAGVARWIFLALWGHKAWNKGEKAAKEFVTKVGQLVIYQQMHVVCCFALLFGMLLLWLASR